MQEKGDSNVSDEIAEDYISSLSDLKFNTKPRITMLTMLAEENQEYAPTIVGAIEKHILETQYKLPALYVIDSIVKNVGGDYKRLFSLKIGQIFTAVFKQVDEKVRKKMYELRQTWVDIFPASRLYWLDTNVAEIDPAWPITATFKPSQKPSPSTIHVNPKFQASNSTEILPTPASGSQSHPVVANTTHKQFKESKDENAKLPEKKKVALDLKKSKEETQGNTIFVAPWKLKQFVKNVATPTPSLPPEAIVPTSNKVSVANKSSPEKNVTRKNDSNSSKNDKKLKENDAKQRSSKKSSSRDKHHSKSRHESKSPEKDRKKHSGSRDRKHSESASSKSRHKSRRSSSPKHSRHRSGSPKRGSPRKEPPILPVVEKSPEKVADKIDIIPSPAEELVETPKESPIVELDKDTIGHSTKISAPVSSCEETTPVTAKAPVISQVQDVDLRTLGVASQITPFTEPAVINPPGLFGKEDVDLRRLPFASFPAVPPPPAIPVFPATQTTTPVSVSNVIDFQEPKDDDEVIFVSTTAPPPPTNIFDETTSGDHPQVNKSSEEFFQACLNQLKDDLHIGKISRMDYNKTVQDLHTAKEQNKLTAFEQRTQMLRNVTATRNNPVPSFTQSFPTLQPPPLPPRFPPVSTVAEAAFSVNPVTTSTFKPIDPAPVMDVHSLLAKLHTTGMLPDKENSSIREPPKSKTPDPVPEPRPVTPVAVRSRQFLKNVPDNDAMFKSSNLKTRNKTLISHLYKGMQCSSCGLRIPANQKTLYSRHLDWHFRMNKKQQDSTRKANIRQLYLTIPQWIQYEEVDTTEEQTSTIFDMVPRNIADAQLDPEPIVVAELPTVGADPDKPELANCPVCMETFSNFYDQNSEEWRYKNAINCEGRNYHPGCWEDFEKQKNASIFASTVEDFDEATVDSTTSLPPIISALLSNTSRGGTPVMDTFSDTPLAGSRRDSPIIDSGASDISIVEEPQEDLEVLPPPPVPVIETIEIDDDAPYEAPKDTIPRRKRATFEKAEPFTVRVKVENDEEMQVHIPPPMPRLLADIPIKIEIKDEPENTPQTNGHPEDTDIMLWSNGTDNTAIDIDGNTEQPIMDTSVPVIRLNIGKSSNIIAREPKEDDDFLINPPPFSYDAQKNPLFAGAELKSTPIEISGWEDSSLCTIM